MREDTTGIGLPTPSLRKSNIPSRGLEKEAGME